MSEVVRPLITLPPGKVFTSDEDGAIIITEAHSHSDVLRYVVADIGRDEAMALLEGMADD